MDHNTENLKAAARSAAERAYSPYSGFGVGCALEAANGEIVTGCNVENASYGLTICAERNALFAAVARGCLRKDLRRMVIYTPGEQVHTSCGACRQVMVELMPPDAELLLTCDSDDQQRLTVADCLPDPFTLQP